MGVAIPPSLSSLSSIHPLPLPPVHAQELNERIAHLKDQLQELKAKTGLEAKYTNKATQVWWRGHGVDGAGWLASLYIYTS